MTLQQTCNTHRTNTPYSHVDRNIPPEKACREDIPDLLHQYSTTANGNFFLGRDTGVRDQERIFVLAKTEKITAILKRNM